MPLPSGGLTPQIPHCGGKNEKLSKAGSDRIKPMINSSKVYDDGKHVELQQILNSSQDPAV